MEFGCKCVHCIAARGYRNRTTLLARRTVLWYVIMVPSVIVDATWTITLFAKHPWLMVMVYI